MSGAWAWVILVALTLGSWLLFEQGIDAKFAATAVVIDAGVKVNIVISRFMELEWTPAPFRMLTALWALGAVAVIIGGYWF